MAEPAKPMRMTADEFLAWSEGRPGKLELYAGIVVEGAAERVSHAEAKFAATLALKTAIRDAGLPCQAIIDGPAIRTANDMIFEPDALVRCGAPLDGDAVEVPDPVVLVEVASPSTSRIDSGLKLDGYFAMESVRHYLLLNAPRRVVVHHRRAEDGTIRTAVLAGGTLRLDPPGLAVEIEALFPAEG
jgi:Uma2 family endonuclease